MRRNVFLNLAALLVLMGVGDAHAQTVNEHFIPMVKKRRVMTGSMPNSRSNYPEFSWDRFH